MTAARNFVPIAEVKAALNDRIEALCRDLLPTGYRHRTDWLFKGDSGFGCSGQVCLAGPKTGVFVTWADEGGGDVLTMIAQLECGGDIKRAILWAQDWLGLRPGDLAPDDAELAARREARRRRHELEAAANAEETARRQRAALKIWLAAEPRLAGTPAERYLLGRDIDLGRLGRQPRALRYHPQLWCELTGRHWPALVAAVLRDGRHVATHRIFLEIKSDGTVGKAPILDRRGDSQAKRSYGPKRGGVIPLWRGNGRKPLAEASAGSACWIAEGIEDGLAIALLTGGVERVLAGIDLGNIAQLALPPAIATIVIAGQNDAWWHEASDRSHAARRGLDNAIRHFQGQGRAVRVWRTDQPGCKDANDHLRHVLSEGEKACA